MYTQVLIGANEGIMEGITNLVGSKITNAVLQTSYGTNFKGINDYQLFKHIDPIVGGTNRPATSDIRDQLHGILSTTLNFQQRIVANVE